MTFLLSILDYQHNMESLSRFLIVCYNIAKWIIMNNLVVDTILSSSLLVLDHSLLMLAVIILLVVYFIQYKSIRMYNTISLILSTVVVRLVSYAIVEIELIELDLIERESSSLLSESEFRQLTARIIPVGEELIPWHNTQAILNGIKGLNRMYNSLEEGSRLKAYIDNNCLHLLKPLEGYTGIPTSYRDVNVLKGLPDVINMKSSYSRNLFESLTGNTGVYAFFLDDELVQCGSALQYSNRVQSHYIDSKDGMFVFGNHPITRYNWVPLYNTTHYAFDYANNHSMTVQEEQILSYFTQQEIRSIEQAYSQFAQPSNYKGTNVNMWHSNWQDGIDYSYVSTGKTITWVTESGETHTRSSIASSTDDLGFSSNRIKAVAKVEGALLDTVKYGPVSISIEGVAKGSDYADLRSGTPLNTSIDMEKLSPNKYYVYDSEMNQLPLGPFNTGKEVNVALGLKEEYTGISTWCNYKHLINAVALGISVYIVKLYTNGPIRLIITYLRDNTTKEFPSVRSVCDELKLSNSAVLLRITNDMPDTTSKGEPYQISCKYDSDKIKLIQRVNKNKLAKSQRSNKR